MTDQPIQRFFHHGADLAGATVGYAAEFFQKAPAGTGALIAVGVASVIKEVAARHLAPRELTRVSAAAAFATERIGARLIAGFNPRSDGFFDGTRNIRSPSEELLEAVLLKARDAFEEKKVRYIGLFYANVVFADYVSPQTAHLLLKQLERLSFRQLCLLAFVGSRGSLDVEVLRRPNHETPELEALKREEMDLHASDLGTMGLFSGVGPWVDELSTLGKVLHDLAGLDELPEVDKSLLDATLQSLRQSK